MDFFAIDVETANADYSSICQIGLAQFKDGQIIDKWSTLVDPKEFFDPFNISIHGITEKDVKGAPTFDLIYKEISNRVDEEILIHHMPFDRVAINRACSKYRLNILNLKWLDSAKIVRRTWEEFAYNGYGLANVAKFLNIKFAHHDALEDALTAAQIVYHACNKTGLSIEDWVTRVNKPLFLNQNSSSTIKFEGNPEGPLYGENLVFTGSLSLTRKEAGIIAANLGCNVTNSVTNKTTMLIVGAQDKSKLVGYEKSSKHRKTEELITNGANIKILSEKDLIEMCDADTMSQNNK